jgi:N6-adenosine-specific RNA methylase IME4
MIQVVSPGPYLELFAREKAPGWSVWGNELENDIEMPSVVK